MYYNNLISFCIKDGRNFFAPAYKSLTYKPVLAICGPLLFCGFLSWFIAMYLETKSATTDVLSFASPLSDLTKQSIQYDMLTSTNRIVMQLPATFMMAIKHSGRKTG